MVAVLYLFGADKIPLDHISTLKDKAPNIIIWAAPVMFLFVLIEVIISYTQKHNYYERQETIGSIMVGIGNISIAALLKITLFYTAVVAYNLVPWRMELVGWTFIPCYIIYDFLSYWAHSISHRQRFWWATHVVHHTGEHFNLTVSFRLSWVQHLKIVFLLPVAFMGFHPIVFFVVYQIAVLFQFWTHTEYIRKLHPVIEYLFATPSNHRVHHGSQEKYINKNYGATFILWDRIFGTYQKEEEQAIYGTTERLVNKANPVYINFHEYISMWRDVCGARGMRSKLFFIFGNPIDVAREKRSGLKNDPKTDITSILPFRSKAEKNSKRVKVHVV